MTTNKTFKINNSWFLRKNNKITLEILPTILRKKLSYSKMLQQFRDWRIRFSKIMIRPIIVLSRMMRSKKWVSQNQHLFQKLSSKVKRITLFLHSTRKAKVKTFQWVKAQLLFQLFLQTKSSYQLATMRVASFHRLLKPHRIARKDKNKRFS